MQRLRRSLVTGLVVTVPLVDQYRGVRLALSADRWRDGSGIRTLARARDPAYYTVAMAMGRATQASMWVATRPAAECRASVLQATESILERAAFDAYVERLCRRPWGSSYADEVGRPGLRVAIYLLSGTSKGSTPSGRSDSLIFLGLELHEAPPDHYGLAHGPDRHRNASGGVVGVAATRAANLVKGKTIGVDATTAALRSIVRRDTGEGYEEFLTRLAQASGIATPTREDVARLDRQRKHKGSNDDWQHPYDPTRKSRR